MWSHLERQGGTGGSPIGTKGPGETQLETDRRHIRRKIDKLKEELEEVRRVRATQRQPAMVAVLGRIDGFIVTFPSAKVRTRTRSAVVSIALR